MSTREIPFDTIRRCCVCRQPIEHLHKRRTTCGHPRCMRTNRARKPVPVAKPVPLLPGEMLKGLVARGVEYGHAVTVVAARYKMRPVDVMALEDR